MSSNNPAYWPRYGAMIDLSVSLAEEPEEPANNKNVAQLGALTASERHAFFTTCAVVFPILRRAAQAAGVRMLTPSTAEPSGGGGARRKTSGRYYVQTYLTFKANASDWEQASTWLSEALDQVQRQHPEIQLVFLTEMRPGA